MAKYVRESSWAPRVIEGHVVESTQGGTRRTRKRSAAPTRAEIAQLRRNVTRAYRSASPATQAHVSVLVAALFARGEA